MRKLMASCLVIILVIMCSVSVYADESTYSGTRAITNDVLEYFEWSIEDLESNVLYHETYVYNARIYSLYDIQISNKVGAVEVGSLTINSGFVRDRLTTFSDYKKLSGVGVEDTVVGAYVFHYETVVNKLGEEERKMVPTQDLLSEIGRSGLYNETIEIDYIGDNYVLIAVDGEEPIFKLFKVVRKELKTKEILENIQIEFFDYNKDEEDPSFEEYVPSFLEFGF